MKKIGLILGIVIVICCSAFVAYQLLLFGTLPRYYNSKAFKDTGQYSEEEMIFKNPQNHEFLLVVPVYGAMAFSSNNNMLGIYDGSKELKAVIQLGSIPLRLRYWKAEEIGLWVLNERDELDYVESWITNKNRLWKYKLKYFLKETGQEIK